MALLELRSRRGRMNRFTAPSSHGRSGQFIVRDEGPIIRLWCRFCEKSAHLPDLNVGTITEMEAAHVCGPRTSGWGSPGVSW